MKRALFLLILMGCGGDAAGPSSISPPPPPPPPPPPAPFQLAFSAVVNSKGFDPATNREECRYSVTAVASGGSSGEFALWNTYDWEFRHPDGTVQTIFATQSESVDFWGSDRLIYSSSRTANRIAWHPTKKFTLFYTFRYTLITGEQRSQFLSIDCI